MVDFDRARLRLGTIVYVHFTTEGQPTAVSSESSPGRVPFSVGWIAPSEWYVVLGERSDIMPSNLAKRVSELLLGFMTAAEIESNLTAFAQRVRIEHLYETREFTSNPVSVVETVTDRLDLCSRLSTPEAEDALWSHQQALVVFLLLTCFDRLGQPADWVDFGSWLQSDRHSEEREACESVIPANLGYAEIAQKLHAQYLQLYGTRNSFFRFLRDTLPLNMRKVVLDSLDIRRSSNPPDIKSFPPASDSEKQEYLFKIRNEYTHSARYVAGTGPTIFPTSGAWVQRDQEFRTDHWVSVAVTGWPDILRLAVCAGLAAYLRTAIEGT